MRKITCDCVVQEVIYVWYSDCVVQDTKAALMTGTEGLMYSTFESVIWGFMNLPTSADVSTKTNSSRAWEF